MLMEKEGVSVVPAGNRCTTRSWRRLMRRKPIEKSIEQNTLPRILRWYDLITYGMSAAVGSGIFVIAGNVAHTMTGPAIVISVLIAGVASLLTGFCYLEFASQIPTTGSAYVYAYSSLGEIIGWFIGWNLTLEYAFSAAAVAGSWTNYFVQFFKSVGVTIPVGLYAIKTSWSFTVINPLALIVVAVVSAVLLLGVKSTAMFTNVMTVLNITTILFIIIAGAVFVDPANWTPFAPSGANGIFQGATNMFFSYVGFDTVCTLTAEARRPNRDIPIAVITTVTLATVLYVFLSLVLTGMVPYLQIDSKAPLAEAFMYIKHPQKWISIIIGVCSITTMTATALACLAGQPRIFYSMAQDGLIPRVFCHRYWNGVPVAGVLMTFVIAGLLALLVDVNQLAELISLGVLLAFTVVAGGLIILRFSRAKDMSRRPVIFGSCCVLHLMVGTFVTSMVLTKSGNWWAVIPVFIVGMPAPFIALMVLFLRFRSDLRARHDGFACPLMPLLPAIAIICNMYLMSQTSGTSFAIFGGWTGIGLVIYFAYGLFHSDLRRPLSVLPKETVKAEEGGSITSESGVAESDKADDKSALIIDAAVSDKPVVATIAEIAQR